MRAFDQAGDVGEHEFAAIDLDHPELRMQCGERIIGNLGLGRAHRRQQSRFAGIGQTDDSGIGNKLKPQA